MKVAIGSDKSGFTLKEAVKQYLIANNIEFDDFGTTDTEHAKGFFLVAPAVAEQIQSGTTTAHIVCARARA
jgi:ribose 5-phosphate isomerase B